MLRSTVFYRPSLINIEMKKRFSSSSKTLALLKIWQKSRFAVSVISLLRLYLQPYEYPYRHGLINLQ